MPNGPPSFVSKGSVNSLFNIHSLKSGKRVHLYQQKKLLILAKIGVVFQPNISEKGIFSVPEIKHDIHSDRESSARAQNFMSAFKYQTHQRHKILRSG